MLQAEGMAQAKAWWQESIAIFAVENTESSVPLRARFGMTNQTHTGEKVILKFFKVLGRSHHTRDLLCSRQN